MMLMNSCSDENSNPQKPDNPMESDANYVGKAQDGFTAEEWYPGGELGTTENVNSGCYEDEAPAVNEQGLHDNFKTGEMFFERQYTIDNGAFKGVGPAYLRKSASTATQATDTACDRTAMPSPMATVTAT